jgi:hypothetical protein
LSERPAPGLLKTGNNVKIEFSPLDETGFIGINPLQKDT